MRPLNFSMRAGCHWHLSEILRFEKKLGDEAAKEKIVDFLDGNADFYDQLEDFLDCVFEHRCAARMAVFQYLCAKHRICYTDAPAYMDFMLKTYESYTDLINDESEYWYLSEETKNKLSENENLKKVSNEWKEAYFNSQKRINELNDLVIQKDYQRQGIESVAVKGASEFAILTEQLAEKDRQIEALMKLIQKLKE